MKHHTIETYKAVIEIVAGEPLTEEAQFILSRSETTKVVDEYYLFISKVDYTLSQWFLKSKCNKYAVEKFFLNKRL